MAVKIYLIHAQGQTIPQKVLAGVANQSVECCIVPITQEEGKTPRLNSINNWIRALEFRTDEIFIGMDTDVVMDDRDTIKVLLDKTKECFMSTIRTQTVQCKHEKDVKIKMAHALFACSKPEILLKELILIKKSWDGSCSM